MKQFYVDSSVAIALLLEEPSAANFRQITQDTEKLVSSSLIEAEVFATASREKVPWETAVGILDPISFIFPDRSLEEELKIVLMGGTCRGSDAYHLATLLFFDPDRREIELLTTDKRQIEVAKKIGIKIATEIRDHP